MRACLALLFAQFAGAQPLTMEQAVEMALRQSPDAAAIRASLAVVAGQSYLASSLSQPEIRWNSNNLGFDPDLAGLRTNVGLRWSPPRPGEMKWKLRAARAKEKSASAEIQSFEAKLAAEVRHVFRRAVILLERASLAKASLEMRTKALEVVQRQVTAGLKDSNEADLAELALADAAADTKRVEMLATKEVTVLMRLIGRSSATAAGLQLPTMDPLQPSDREQAAREALSKRAELIELGGACEEASASEAAARNKRYPWLSFVQVNRRVGVISEITNGGSWGVQFGIELPLFRTAAAAEQKIAGAERQRCEAQTLAVKARIRREVDAAIDELASSASGLAEIERLRTGPAARIVANLKRALALGRSELTEVMQAELRQQALRERWLERRLEHAALEHRFELAMGG